MIHQDWIEYGEVFAIRYEFERVGEGLPMHEHPEAEEHNLVVLHGTISVRGDDSRAFYQVGEIAWLPKRHEIVAMEAHSAVLAFFKHGKPETYSRMPVSERSVAYESRL